MARNSTCRGASPNPRTTRAISSSLINIRTSACPGLGLKRGLSENKVVAPYATGLAAMIDGEAALANFRALAVLGACGRYGYFEAVDFTPSRLPEDSLVRAGALLYGASPGHEHRRDRQRAERWAHAGALPFRRRGAGHRSAVAGTHAARRLGGASARRGSGHRGSHHRPAGTGGAPAVEPARLRAADPSALERALRRHDQRRRIRLQPLERSRDHALARRHHARRHGQLHPAA